MKIKNYIVLGVMLTSVFGVAEAGLRDRAKAKIKEKAAEFVDSAEVKVKDNFRAAKEKIQPTIDKIKEEVEPVVEEMIVEVKSAAKDVEHFAYSTRDKTEELVTEAIVSVMKDEPFEVQSVFDQGEAWKNTWNEETSEMERTELTEGMLLKSGDVLEIGNTFCVLKTPCGQHLGIAANSTITIYSN